MHPSSLLCWHAVTVVALSILCGACVTPAAVSPSARLDADTRARYDTISCDEPGLELDVVYFEQGSAELTDVAQTRLTGNLYLLNRCVALAIWIYGWTDDSPVEAPVSIPLSGQRAEAVRVFYVTHGVAADRIVRVQGYGTDPVSRPYSEEPEPDPHEDRVYTKMRRADSTPIQP